MKGKDKLVGAVCIRKDGTMRELSFEEILLDETLVQGELWVQKNALQEAGGMNYRLKEKRGYELLLRIADRYAVLQCGESEAGKVMPDAEDRAGEGWLRPGTEDEEMEDPAGQATGWETDCYLISRYKDKLLEADCFGDAVLGVLGAGGEAAAAYLEKMLMQSEEYNRIFDCTQPFLIYRGDELCYYVLDTFAVWLGQALEDLGQRVEYFDTSKLGIEDLGDYERRRFKAVIGFQTYMFSVRYQNDKFVHDRIGGRKYNFVFDHPVWLKPHLMQTPENLCVLTPDGNYAEFIQTYYGLSARFLPPAGREVYQGKKERALKLVFLGSNKEGLIDNLRTVWRADRKRSHMISRWILFMRNYLEETPEQALGRVLAYYGLTFTKKEFLEWMYRERWVILGLAGQYRRRVMEKLLNAGITLDVFGESWKDSSLYGHPGLICHEEVTGEAALEIYADAKLSLNVMTWHKDGFTERIANAMLQKSVVVTDRTTYLERHFEDGEDLLLFELEQMKDLPERVLELLHNDHERERIAENGYKKAQKYHTWRRRAEELMELMEE